VTGALATDVTVERIELSEGSWVDVARGFVTDAGAVFHTLRDSVTWKGSRLWRYEKWVEEPRVGAFFRAGRYPEPVLTDAHRWLQHRYSVQFDSVALAYSRDAHDGQAFHRDRDMRHCEDTVIAILTFGATRPWLLRPRARADKWIAEHGGATVDVAPAGGDLLVMGGRCQVDWEHSVPKLGRRPGAARISAQWRWTSGRGRPEVGGSYRAARNFSRSP
jgi:alkylated DNA repair dioxygenase AlkB